MPAVHPLVASLRGRLIVSVQAYPGEPMRDPAVMAAVARSCELGGAAAIRCQGTADIAAIKGRVGVPVVGLWKEGAGGVYITPTARHARACALAGADVVAVDATGRPRPDGRPLADTVAAVRAEGALLMADCASVDDVRRAAGLGFDLVSTTLSHGGPATALPAGAGPDLGLVRLAASEFPGLPVVCEGGVHAPADAAAALEAGAWAVVVGTAITHPASLTRWFADALG